MTSDSNVTKQGAAHTAIQAFLDSEESRPYRLMMQMVEKGASQRAIGKTFGLSQSTVHRILKMMNNIARSDAS